jgi:hypothetical protein
MGQSFAAEEALLALKREGWSVGDVCLVGPSGVVWLVTGTREGRTLRAEGASREEAWREALRLAEAEGTRGPSLNGFVG